MSETPATNKPFLGDDFEADEHGDVFDKRDIQEGEVGKPETYHHMHRTGDHWTITEVDGTTRRLINIGEQRFRIVGSGYVYKAALLENHLEYRPEIGWLASSVTTGDHERLGVAIKALIDEIGIPTWYLEVHSSYPEEVWEAVCDGTLEPTLATVHAMIEVIYEHEHMDMEWAPQPGGDEPLRSGPIDAALAAVIEKHLIDSVESREEFASRSGIDLSRVNALLDVEEVFTIGDLMVIGEALGVRPSELAAQAESKIKEEK
jgi:hypothetical protein